VEAQYALAGVVVSTSVTAGGATWCSSRTALIEESDARR